VEGDLFVPGTDQVVHNVAGVLGGQGKEITCSGLNTPSVHLWYMYIYNHVMYMYIIV
jgi:hypothetical protein